jgi:hypothetical protein
MMRKNIRYFILESQCRRIFNMNNIKKSILFIKPYLSTNLKTIAICSLLDASRASSTIMQNLESPISSWILSHTLLAMTCKISFRILCEVYFADVGAFSKTTVAIFSLYDDKILIISRKLPRFFESGVSSWPPKAHPWNASHWTTSIEVFTRSRLFWICSILCAFNNLSICCDCYFKSSQDFTALLWGEQGPSPIWVKKTHFFPSWTFFQFLNPLVINTSHSGRPTGFIVKR